MKAPALALAVVAAVGIACSAAHAQSDAQVKQSIIRDSIASYPGPCPCPYSGSTCQGHSAYENPASQSIYCYTKDVPADMVSTYRVTLASRPSNDEAR